MKTLVLITGLSLVAGSACAGPIGTWHVEDGSSTIEIAPCGPALCGTVASTNKPDQKDSKNPDASKRNRTVLGTTVLQNMRLEGTKWAGSIYNPRDGHTYDAKISMHDENTLHVEGCIMGGMLCGGQNWPRIVDSASAAPVRPALESVKNSVVSAEASQPQEAQAPESSVQQPSITAEVKQHSTKALSFTDVDPSQFTEDQAAAAGQTAADLINQMLLEHGVAGARIDRGDAALTARSAMKMIKSMSRKD